MPTSEPGARRASRPRPRTDRARPLRLPPQRRLLLERLGNPGRGRAARAARAGHRRRRAAAARRRRAGQSPGPAGAACNRCSAAVPAAACSTPPDRAAAACTPGAAPTPSRSPAGSSRGSPCTIRAAPSRRCRTCAPPPGSGCVDPALLVLAPLPRARGDLRRPRRAPRAAAGDEHAPAPRLGRLVGVGNAGARRVRAQRGTRDTCSATCSRCGPMRARWTRRRRGHSPPGSPSWTPDDAASTTTRDGCRIRRSTRIVRAAAPVGLAVPPPIASVAGARAGARARR